LSLFSLTSTLGNTAAKFLTNLRTQSPAIDTPMIMPNQTVLVIQQLTQMKFADVQCSPRFNLNGKSLQRPTRTGCQVDVGDAAPVNRSAVPGIVDIGSPACDRGLRGCGSGCPAAVENPRGGTLPLRGLAESRSE